MKEELEEIGIEELGYLKIGKNTRNLYWHGEKVRTEIHLTFIQKFIGALLVVAAISSPIISALSNWDDIERNLGIGEKQAAETTEME